MFPHSRPNGRQIRRFLAAQAGRPLSYGEVGRSQGAPPAGYFFDCDRGELGAGPAVWAAACQALRRWEMFGVGWVQVAPKRPRLEVGREVAIVVGKAGLWTLNAARIVYVVDEDDDQVARLGFGYGTLPDHLERGEERFLVEWDRRTNRVDYEIRAFSWPNHWIACCGFPLMRRFQRQFRRDSIRAMQRAVAAAAAPSLAILGSPPRQRAAGFTPADPGDLVSNADLRVARPVEGQGPPVARAVPRSETSSARSPGSAGVKPAAR
jgi:uncharacterized protein (UPF0548 family)